MENKWQGTPTASQSFTVGKVATILTTTSAVRTHKAAVNPLARRPTTSFSPLRDLHSSERALDHGMKMDASSDSTFVPTAGPQAGGFFRGKGARAFVRGK